MTEISVPGLVPYPSFARAIRRQARTSPLVAKFDVIYYNRNGTNRTGHLKHGYYGSAIFFLENPNRLWQVLASGIRQPYDLTRSLLNPDWKAFLRRHSRDKSTSLGFSFDTMLQTLPSSVGGRQTSGGGAIYPLKLVMPLAASFLAPRIGKRAAEDRTDEPEVENDIDQRPDDARIRIAAVEREIDNRMEHGDYSVPDEWGRRRVRVGVGRWRAKVLANCNGECVVCGLKIPELLDAAHIRSWKSNKTDRLNPANGFLLCSLHHRAFDRGLWSSEGGLITIVSRLLSSTDTAVKSMLVQYNGKALPRPRRWAFLDPT